MADLLGTLKRHRLGLFVVLVGLLLAWILWSVKGALAAFIIGVALAFVLDPLVTFLQRRGVPRWGGVLVAYAAVVALVAAIVAYAIPPIAAQARELISHMPQLSAALSDWQQALIDWYESLPLPLELREALDESIRNAQSALGGVLGEIVGPAIAALLRAAGFLVGLVVIPVWLFYVLKDRERLPAAVNRALPEGWRPDAGNVLAILAGVGGSWVRGQLILGAAIFAATVIGLTILTVIGFSEFGSFTLVLAVIAGVLEWFPIIGPVIAAIPAILIGLSISPAAALAAVILYTAIQQLENHLLVPKVMGDAVDLHPAVIIMSLVIGGALFGIGGAILAAPVVAIGRDLYRYTFRRLRGEGPDTAFTAVAPKMAARSAEPKETPPEPAAAEPAPD
ncbi:MAG TPA: AI-2E family transporter [Candidatus Limnocylindria bacterium]|nr:AI-2E family transporter [Candidatus Limnocylindria bacterium]